VSDASPTRLGSPSAGVEDLVIVPLVVIALAISRLLKAVLSILIYVLDYAFPILLQLMRIPLLTARLIGDGMELLFEGIVRCLPVSSAKRDAWRARVRQQWIWFRRNISYLAFEHALHHVFEAGMAWVFRKCRKLTPGGALLVMPSRCSGCLYLLASSLRRRSRYRRGCNCCTPSQPSSLRANCSYCRCTQLLGRRRNNIQLCRGFSNSVVIA
jgi:hypothetical protein